MLLLWNFICDVLLSEVQCLNETQKYLRKVVHEMGLELRSTAVCKGVRRTRDGTFTLQDALNRHQWTAADVTRAVRQYHAARKNRLSSRSKAVITNTRSNQEEHSNREVHSSEGT